MRRLSLSDIAKPQLLALAFILVLLCLESDTRQALLVTPVWFVLLAVTYQTVRRKRQARAPVPAAAPRQS